MSDLAILLIAWRRPELTQRVVDTIRAARPQKVFVALDGPRPGDEQACSQVERLVYEGLSDFQLQVLRHDLNKGCRVAVSEAIDWFFSQVDRGVVLEDDTVPDPSFFAYCQELLDRYADDPSIGMVSGVNLLGSWASSGADYFFGHGGIWGWATWRDRWSRYDVTMSAWRNSEARTRARRFLGRSDWAVNRPLFARTANGEIDTWDYQWSFTRASHEWLSVIPSVNLVNNAGFGLGATHTVDSGSPLAHLPVGTVSATLSHPSSSHFDRGYQAAVRRLEHPPLTRRFRHQLQRASLR